jgi:hypothetical protein
MFKKNHLYQMAFFLLIVSILVWGQINTSGPKTNPKQIELNVSNRSPKSYEIIKKSYLNKGTKIDFPQIAALRNGKKERSINTQIKNEALKIRNYYEGIKNDLTLEVSYKITLKSECLLSIQYYGIGYVKNAAYPNNIFFTTNLNIREGNRLRLKELINIDQNIIAKIRNGKFKALNPDQNRVLKGFTDDELIIKLNQADSLDQIENHGTFSYLTKNSLGISFSVIHALGDHAEFEIKYRELKNNLKIDLR